MYTYATPRIMGSVKVESPTGFSQALAPQLLVASDDEEVESARASSTRSGTAMLSIDSILPIACG